MTMYARSAVTIASILDAAAALFTTRNYADVTMADIADAAEVTKGALYHHFSGKEELYLRLMHDYLAEVGELLSGVVAATVGQPSRDRLHRFTLTFLRQPPLKRELMHLVRRDINIFQAQEREALIHAYQAALPQQAEAIIRDGIAAGEIVAEDARLLSWEHVAIVEVVLRPYAASILGSPERIADYVISLYFDGVGKGVSHVD
jgi:AcrR family transcriptional regulator